jgi:alpha-beta hydrolase superfamily lysophospholipase
MSALTAAALVLILPALYFAARGIIYLFAQKEAVVPRGGEPGTPADLGLDYDELTIQSGSRALQAWWVKAARSHDSHKAILIYHGTNETISEWLPALQRLSQNGVSSFIFDYSGFGYSTGRGTFRTLREDALAARVLFDEKAGPAVDKYLLGLSLGSGVLLEGHARLTLGTCGVILVAAFTSLGDVALAWKLVPAPWHTSRRPFTTMCSSSALCARRC